MGINYNVTLRAIDRYTHQVASEITGHNTATNTLVTGIGHYLKGDGVLNQGYEMLSQFIPRYISLGTMGLLNQDADENGLPTGIGVTPKQAGETDEEFEIRRYVDYMNTLPGYGADGYDPNQNNNRAYLGLGPMFSGTAVNCELISPSFPRAQITYRQILPEMQSEIPQTIDIVFSAFISTGALKQFRGDNDYVFITECGLWASKDWISAAGNGLLAGYRLIPPNDDERDMTVPENREILRRNILRVGKNQIVQVIWKIQVGAMDQFGGMYDALRNLMQRYEELEIEYERAIREVGGIGGEVTLNTIGSIGGVFGKIELPNLPYIQANGTQGIRCDFTPSSTDVKYELKYADADVASDANWHQLFGGYSNNMRPGGIGSSKSVYGNNLVCCIGGGEALTDVGFTRGAYHEITVQISGSSVTVLFDDMSFSSTWSGGITCPVGLCCGATASGTQEYSTVKVFGFKIWEGGVLKRNFSPATVNDRAGFYDAVSDTMFYSATGTDFVYVPAAEEE